MPPHPQSHKYIDYLYFTGLLTTAACRANIHTEQQQQPAALAGENGLEEGGPIKVARH